MRPSKERLFWAAPPPWVDPSDPPREGPASSRAPRRGAHDFVSWPPFLFLRWGGGNPGLCAALGGPSMKNARNVQSRGLRISRRDLFQGSRGIFFGIHGPLLRRGPWLQAGAPYGGPGMWPWFHGPLTPGPPSGPAEGPLQLQCPLPL